MAMNYKELDTIANEIRREFSKDGVEVDSHTVDARLGIGKLKLNFGGFFENLEVLRDFIISQWGMQSMSVEEIDGSISTVVTLGSRPGETPAVGSRRPVHQSEGTAASSSMPRASNGDQDIRHRPAAASTSADSTSSTQDAPGASAAGEQCSKARLDVWRLMMIMSFVSSVIGAVYIMKGWMDS